MDNLNTVILTAHGWGAIILLALALFALTKVVCDIIIILIKEIIIFKNKYGKRE
jgi:hypothetical protein